MNHNRTQVKTFKFYSNESVPDKTDKTEKERKSRTYSFLGLLTGGVRTRFIKSRQVLMSQLVNSNPNKEEKVNMYYMIYIHI